MNELNTKQPAPGAIYPFEEITDSKAFPSPEEFHIVRDEDGRGLGVRSLRDFKRGTKVAAITGMISPEIKLHTLQISSHAHLYDPFFSGFFLHSCSPNIFVDMENFEVWAIRNIKVGDLLEMDYAGTEDVLYRQFPCFCKSERCRHWITGRREQVNQEGRTYLKSLNTPNVVGEG